MTCTEHGTDWNLLFKTPRCTCSQYMTSVHYWGSASSIFFQRQLWQHYFLLVVFILFSPFYSLAQTMGFTTTITLLLLACVTLLRLAFTWLYYNPRPPWILAAVLCIINARHAGKPTMKCFNLLADPFVIRCDWWKILAHNIVVVGPHPQFHYCASYDVCCWSLRILVFNGVWLYCRLDYFGVG